MNPTLCNIPDEIINPLADDLFSLESLADRLRLHAMARVNDDDPDELTQRDELAHIDGIRCIAKELYRRIDELRGVNRLETMVMLTADEHQRLSAVAEKWQVDLNTAASRIVMEEIERRFRVV